MSNLEHEMNEKPIPMDERVERVFAGIANMGYDSFIEAIEKNKELPPDEIIDHDTNLIVGAGNLLSLIDEISEDDDFRAIARSKILIALNEQLRFKPK